MSMRLLLDECIGARQLAKKLGLAGHDVSRSVDALGVGVEDFAVFIFAQQQNRVILTFNSRDFRALGETNPDHAGVVLIYQRNSERDMSHSDIAGALANMSTVFPNGIAGQIVGLNHYRW